MAYEIVSLQGYTFEVGHGQVQIPEDAPAIPGGPTPGATIDVHTLQLLDVLYRPDGTIGGIRRVYEIELSDRQRDELVRQLQGGAPPRDNSQAVAVAGAAVLSQLPHPFPERR